MEKKVLGRGISTLIRSNVSPNVDNQTSQIQTKPVDFSSNEILPGVLEIPVTSIKTNPRQPRKTFEPAALEDLKNSILVHGVLSPILVRQLKEGYELIAGERRFRASQLAGLKTVPAIIKDVSNEVSLEIALIENLQRENLNPMEEARGYDRLAREFFLTQEQISQKVGKERSTVSNVLRLLTLPFSIQKMLEENKLNMGHARAILGLAHAFDQEKMAQEIVSKGASVRMVEKWVQDKKAPSKKQVKIQSAQIKNCIDQLQQKFGTKVNIHERSKGGDISIVYFSNQDLIRITNLLLK